MDLYSVIMDQTTGLWSLALILLGVGYGSAITCPNGQWVSYGDNCYTAGFKQYMDFYDAEMFCRRRNAQLIHIDNVKENEFVKQNLRVFGGQFWIGLTDYLTEGKWVYYANNDTVSFTDWSPGEPNSYQGQEEDCVIAYDSLDYKWADAPCDSYVQPLCERAAHSTATDEVFG